MNEGVIPARGCRDAALLLFMDLASLTFEKSCEMEENGCENFMQMHIIIIQNNNDGSCVIIEYNDVNLDSLTDILTRLN